MIVGRGRPRFVELSCDDVLLLQMRRKIMTLSNGIELQTYDESGEINIHNTLGWGWICTKSMGLTDSACCHIDRPSWTCHI